MATNNRVHLGPPPVLVEASRSVMGAIDFDPFTTPDLNRLVCAAQIYTVTRVTWRQSLLLTGTSQAKSVCLQVALTALSGPENS